MPAEKETSATIGGLPREPAFAQWTLMRLAIMRGGLILSTRATPKDLKQ
jgi:hypothetical protein